MGGETTIVYTVTASIEIKLYVFQVAVRVNAPFHL